MAHAILDEAARVIPRSRTPVNGDGGGAGVGLGSRSLLRLLQKNMMSRLTVNLDLSQGTMGAGAGQTVKLGVDWPEGWGTEDHKEFINNLRLKKCSPVWGQEASG